MLWSSSCPSSSLPRYLGLFLPDIGSWVRLLTLGARIVQVPVAMRRSRKLRWVERGGMWSAIFESRLLDQVQNSSNQNPFCVYDDLHLYLLSLLCGSAIEHLFLCFTYEEFLLFIQQLSALLGDEVHVRRTYKKKQWLRRHQKKLSYKRVRSIRG